MKRLSFLAFAALAACGTPQEQCINQNTRDLRTVDRLIKESEGNLKRGYAYETITVYEEYWRSCPGPRTAPGQPPSPPRMCLDRRPELEQRPKAIDLKEEARTLASLKEKRKGLARQAEKVIAACKAQYPE
ncbi:hypothetical protein [Tabrizicola sp.]|uniref:hypothetical protein n=1 Tax=Tabrizicola sp. TaxID=2005166 RepID=UPI002FDD4414